MGKKWDMVGKKRYFNGHLSMTVETAKKGSLERNRSDRRAAGGVLVFIEGRMQ